MKRKILYISALLLMVTGISEARTFSENFSDSTLRVDYVFGGKAGEPIILFDGASKRPGWAGKRVEMDKLPVAGNGRVTVTDAATGDTLYRTSFSTLYQEWLATDEAAVLPRSFEHVALMPLPKREALVSIDLSDSRLQTISRHQWKYSPSDVLVAIKDIPALPHQYVHRATAPGNAIDVAILAEGYTAEEMDSFIVHAKRAADEILGYDPFSKYADRFNFVAVETPSIDSGVSVPRFADWRRTAIGSHFSTFYSDRYLTTPRVKQMHDLLEGIPYEHIIVLANTDEYGGGGIYNDYTLTTARHKLFKPVVVHEFGHSFAGLADEYFYDNDVMLDSYPTDVEPWEQNITTQIDFPSKWADMMDTPGVGLFEGGGYSSKGIYRPADECRMRNNTWPTFCPVCRRAIERVIVSQLAD